jgi:translation initiation factor 2 subunit 1
MLYTKQGFPEEDELVLCTVTRVMYYSVFVKLDEYHNKTGMIHLSEISPGRIRNVRDFVVEGKKIVCKVLNVNKEKGHIDLSLRRVNENQRRMKVNEIKQEQIAEKIIENLALKLKTDFKLLYDQISKKILTRYEYLYDCFEQVVRSGLNLKSLGIDPKIADELTTYIKQRIKLRLVDINSELKLRSYAPNGLNVIKQGLKQIQDMDKNISIYYEGGGKYRLKVKADNFKSAERILNNAFNKITKYMNQTNGEVQLKRLD